MPPHPAKPPLRDALRSLGGGLLWLSVLFGVDVYDSVWRLRASARKIRTDKAALEMAFDAIVDYVLRAGLAYLLVAVVAAMLLHAAMKLWFPREPGNKAWWLAAVVSGVLGTLCFYSIDMVLFPLRHTWFPWIEAYADTAHPVPLQLGWSALGLALVVQAWRRHDAASRRRFWVALLGGVAVVGVWLGVTHPPRTAPATDNAGMNVVIIGIDGLRPDHLSAYGYERQTAPNIDAFLDEAVAFDSAWTVFARTYPSWTSILSGQLPLNHGIRDNLPIPSELVSDEARLLPQELKERGYHTVWLTDDSRFAYMVPETGFERIVQPQVGIQNFAISANEPYFRLLGGLLYNPVGWAINPVLEHNQAHGRTFQPLMFVEEASNVLREASRHDKFLYTVHSCVLHAPGDRPWPWHRMYGQAGYSGPNRFRYNRAGTTLALTKNEDGLDQRDVAAQDQRLYDAGLDMADALVGQLMDDLREGDLLDNTIVVLLSDHGEESWEPELPYRYFGPNHGYHVFGDRQHRTLLAVRFPDGRGAGSRVTAPVRTIDLAPTLAESLDLVWGAPMDGRSMLPLVDGEVEAEPRPLYVETGMTEKRYWNKGHAAYAWSGVSKRYRIDPETGFVHVRPEFKPYLMAAKDRAYQVGDWKLVWRPSDMAPAVIHLFNRAEDPLNLHDLAEQHPERVAELGLPLAEILADDDIGEPRVAAWAEQLGLELPRRLAWAAQRQEARWERERAAAEREAARKAAAGEPADPGDEDDAEEGDGEG